MKGNVVCMAAMGGMDGLGENLGNSALDFWIKRQFVVLAGWLLAGRFSALVCLADGEKHDDRSCIAGIFLADRRGGGKRRWLVVSDLRVLSWMAGKSVVVWHGNCIEWFV